MWEVKSTRSCLSLLRAGLGASDSRLPAEWDVELCALWLLIYEILVRDKSQLVWRREDTVVWYRYDTELRCFILRSILRVSFIEGTQREKKIFRKCNMELISGK